jgi:hypothetical protein
MICDFELPESNSFAEFAFNELHLPVFRIEGCLMHYCSAIIQHLKNLGLTGMYMDETSPWLRDFIAKMFSLAFLPVQLIVPVYDAIQNKAASIQFVIFVTSTT